MPELNSQNIFVIYDSPAIAETISLFGKEKKHNITEISSPQLARDKIKKGKPIACILCAMTGKTKSFDICKNIKSNPDLENIKVVILSIDPAKNSQQADDAGADLILELSTSPDEIIKHLEMLINNNGNGLANHITGFEKRLSAAEEKIETLEKLIKNMKKS